jgi:hypothetical protein
MQGSENIEKRKAMQVCFSVRWSHANLLNLLTFEWGVELGNVVQRMSRGLLRACGDASQCRVCTNSRAPRVATVYNLRPAWMRSDVITQVCIASCVRRNFHFYCLAHSILILVKCPFGVGLFNDGSTTDSVYSHVLWWSERVGRW